MFVVNEDSLDCAMVSVSVVGLKQMSIACATLWSTTTIVDVFGKTLTVPYSPDCPPAPALPWTDVVTLLVLTKTSNQVDTRACP